MASNDEGEEGKRREVPAQPRDMQGLLRLAIQHMGTGSGTDDEDAAAASNRLQPLDEERRRWLDDALRGMSVNVAAVMKRAIDMMMVPESTDASGIGEEQRLQVINRKISALDELMEWVDNIDFAIGFHKIGGFAVLRPCLQSKNGDIRNKTAELIAELVQNNPDCQLAAMEVDLIPDLTRLLNTDEYVRVKALYALSGLLRDQEVAQKSFAQCDGYSVLLRAMQSNDDKLKVKGCFLLSALCTEKPTLKVELCDMGFVEQLVAMIECEHDSTHEHVLGLLTVLVSDNECAVRECRRSELNLRRTLMERMELIRGQDQFKEESEYCKTLMDTCFAVMDQEER